MVKCQTVQNNKRNTKATGATTTLSTLRNNKYRTKILYQKSKNYTTSLNALANLPKLNGLTLLQPKPNQIRSGAFVNEYQASCQEQKGRGWRNGVIDRKYSRTVYCTTSENRWYLTMMEKPKRRVWQKEMMSEWSTT